MHVVYSVVVVYMLGETLPPPVQTSSSSVSVQVTATLNPWRAGRGHSALHVVADGKDRARLGARLSHSLSGGERALGLRLNLSQSLVPGAHLALQLTAQLSEHRYLRVALLTFTPQRLIF